MANRNFENNGVVTDGIVDHHLKLKRIKYLEQNFSVENLTLKDIWKRKYEK